MVYRIRTERFEAHLDDTTSDMLKSLCVVIWENFSLEEAKQLREDISIKYASSIMKHIHQVPSPSHEAFSRNSKDVNPALTGVSPSNLAQEKRLILDSIDSESESGSSDSAIADPTQDEQAIRLVEVTAKPSLKKQKFEVFEMLKSLIDIPPQQAYYEDVKRSFEASIAESPAELVSKIRDLNSSEIGPFFLQILQTLDSIESKSWSNRLENRLKSILIGYAVDHLKKTAECNTNEKIGREIKKFFKDARQEHLTSLLNTCGRLYGLFASLGFNLLLVKELSTSQLSRMSLKDLEEFKNSIAKEKYAGDQHFLHCYMLFIKRTVPKNHRAAKLLIEDFARKMSNE